MPDAYRTLVDQLPWLLARETERYVASLRADASEIFADAKVRLTADALNYFLFLASVQKVWATVNCQFWVLDQSLGLLTADHAPNSSRAPTGLQVGRSTYRLGAGYHRALERFRDEFDTLLRGLELRDLIQKGTLVALAKAVGEETLDRGD